MVVAHFHSEQRLCVLAAHAIAAAAFVSKDFKRHFCKTQMFRLLGLGRSS